MNYDTRIFTYDQSAWPLIAQVTDHFRYPLARLHEKLAAEVPRLEVGKDQQTEFHRHFYEIDPSFWELYAGFAGEVCCALAGVRPDEVVYQRRPTFRVHLPGNVATGGWHRDGDYNHPSEEVNFVLPLTAVLPPSPDGHAGNGFFIEDGLAPLVGGGKAQRHFVSPAMIPGELLRFRGSTLLHGSVENRTGLTRVSLDFRLLPKTALAGAADKCTVNQRRPFTMGFDGYYDEFK